jgi:hydrophobic/amphiphilic exporter-1 (mainly G- bacteria), HAE1 family
MIQGKSLVDVAMEASRTHFRPILLASFILGVVPLVVATGAGANARRSLGISVFSGMIASTCLVVLFVSSFFAVLQRFDERRKDKGPKTTKEQAGENPPGHGCFPDPVRTVLPCHATF